MSTVRKTYYCISEDTLKLWYNVVGVDDIAIEYVTNRLSKLYDLNRVENIEDLLAIHNLRLYGRSRDKNTVPYTKEEIQIDSNFMEFVRTAASMCGENADKEELLYQHMYMTSYLGILKAATNLNLTKPGGSYLLNYGRLNTIIDIVLKCLNEMDILDVIELYSEISKGEIAKIYSNKNRSMFLSLLVYLGLNPNDISDYEMFESEKATEISTEKFTEHVINNVYKETKYDDKEGIFKRLSFTESYNLDKARIKN